MRRSVLSGIGVKGRVFPSGDGRSRTCRFEPFLPPPNPSVEGGMDEFFEVLRGLPTKVTSLVIRATRRPIISACCASSASFWASLSHVRGPTAIQSLNHHKPPAATLFCQSREQLLSFHGAGPARFDRAAKGGRGRKDVIVARARRHIPIIPRTTHRD